MCRLPTSAIDTNNERNSGTNRTPRTGKAIPRLASFDRASSCPSAGWHAANAACKPGIRRRRSWQAFEPAAFAASIARDGAHYPTPRRPGISCRDETWTRSVRSLCRVALVRSKRDITSSPGALDHPRVSVVTSGGRDRFEGRLARNLREEGRVWLNPRCLLSTDHSLGSLAIPPQAVPSLWNNGRRLFNRRARKPSIRRRMFWARRLECQTLPTGYPVDSVGPC